METSTPNTPDILRRILARKREEVAERRARRPLPELRARLAEAPPVRGFRAALAARIAAGQPAVIAEIKKASPSRGVLRPDFDPPAIARSYARGGAACLSVLTDAAFQGQDAHLQQARAACTLPVLRKDFVIEEYQVVEARLLGADCILLIAAALAAGPLRDWAALAAELGMDALIEVHDESELERALQFSPPLLGINNRDLHSFHTTLETTVRLLPRVPAGTLLVSESGILEPKDVARLRRHGVQAFLVGEAFMRAPDPGAQLAALFGSA